MQENEKQKIKIAAIVPAYNEEAHIVDVLKVLTNSDLLNEIIVIDDGSTDHTAQKVRQFENIKFLQNSQNQGKAQAMQKGFEQTDAEIIFFCDADLQGLTVEIVSEIISPVIDGQYDMFIGLRNNVLQKMVKPFALNSGERALRREIWEKLPDKFKHSFRIEIGLNFIAKFQGNGYGSKRFDYYQTLKETKYGFFQGMLQRWRMNIDFSYAYWLIFLYWLKIKFPKILAEIKF